MAARHTMPLTKLEREAINDSVLKIQSIQASLEQVDGSRIPGRDEIDTCLETADQSLRSILRDDTRVNKQPTKR